MKQRAVGVLADAAEVSPSSLHLRRHTPSTTTTPPVAKLHRPGSTPAAAAVTGARSQRRVSASYHRIIFASPPPLQPANLYRTYRRGR